MATDGSAYLVGSLAAPIVPNEQDGDFPFWPLPACTGSQIKSGSGIVGFLVKLSPDGSALQYATLLDFAFPFDTIASSVALDAFGKVYVAGFATNENNNGIPGMSGFAVKVDPSQCGADLVWKTEFGAGGTNTRALGITLDSSGSIYVTGSTDDPKFPTTSGPIQSSNPQAPSCIGQCTKAFVMKLATDGTQLLSNYLATKTGHGDVAWGLVVDNTGAPTIAGTTTASDLPTQNAYQQTCNDVVNGGICAFVTKFNSTLSALQWSTYLSGSSTSAGFAIAADTANNVYVTGINEAPDFPVGPPFPSNGCALKNPPFGTCGGLFITSFSPSGQILYSFLCCGDTFGLGIASDPQANIYVAGVTSATNSGVCSPTSANDFPVCPSPSGSNPTFPQVFPGEAGNGFVLKLSANQVADTTPPKISCGTPDGLWHVADVTIACTAADTGSGLANPADASFTLTTSVPASTETANAATNSRNVCDKADNCATAGPISGNMVDKKPPSITITAPTSTDYTIDAAVLANFRCSDGGSGVATCSGPVSNGAAFATTQVGSFTFTVNASDAVGNASSQSVAYNVTYGVCLLYDPTKAKHAGSNVAIKLFLCDANGANVSSPAVVVTALSVTAVATSILFPIDEAGNPSSADLNFRFSSDLVAGGGYVFNLDTSGFPTGTFKLTFHASTDPLTHDVFFQLR